MRKRILSLLVLLCMLMTNAVVYADYTDVGDSTMAERISFVTQIGAMTGHTETTFEPDKEMARGEFLLALMRLMKKTDYMLPTGETVVDDGVERDETAFHYTDVSESYVAEYIETAWQEGYVDATDGPTFRPNDVITAGDAIKWAVNALGYGAAMGDDKSANVYWRVASALDLTTGLSSTKALTRGAAANLLYNMVECPMYWGRDYLEDGKVRTILWDVYGLSKHEGIVQTYDLVSVDSRYSAADGKITIGGSTLDHACPGAEAVIGCDVEAYYGQLDGIETVQIIVVKKNDVFDILAEDIVSWDVVNSKYTYYGENGAEKELKVNANAFVVYNGKATLDKTVANMKPANGEVRLIDNNRDEIYDTVIITSLKNYVVDSTTASTKLVVASSNGTSANFTLDEEKTSFEKIEIFDNNGKLSDFSAVKAGNVISVATSLDNTVMKIYVSTVTVSGTVASQWIENGVPYVKVGEEEYRVDIVSVESRYYESNAMAGRGVKLSLDKYGAIVAVLFTDGEEYAYVVKGYVKSDDNGEKLMVSLFMVTSGKIELYEAAEKIKVTNSAGLTTTINSIDTAALDANGLYELGYTRMKQQIVQVGFTSKGLLKSIKLPVDNTYKYTDATYNGLDEKNFSHDIYGTGIVTGYLNGFADKFATTTSATTFITVPSPFVAGETGTDYSAMNRASEYITDEKYFTKQSSYPFSDNTSVHVSLIDIGKNRMPKLVIKYTNGLVAGHLDQFNAALKVVVDTGTIIDEDDQIVKYIDYYDTEGALKRLTFSKECILDKPSTNVRISAGLKGYSQYVTTPDDTDLTDAMDEAGTYTVDDIKVGFALETKLDADGRIGQFRVHFDPEVSIKNGVVQYSEGGQDQDANKILALGTRNTYRMNTHIGVGKVLEVAPGSMFILNTQMTDGVFNRTYDRTVFKARLYVNGALNVFLFENGKVTPATFEDVVVGDDVFYKARRGSYKDLIIIR